MKWLVFLAVLAYVSATDVVVLKNSNWDSFFKDNPDSIVLVEYFAPWCGHCKKLIPEYETAASELKGSGVLLATVDATEEKDLAQKAGVSGYPTLKIYKNGELVSDYKGPRESAGIVTYMKKQAGPASKLLTETDLVTYSITPTEFSIVGRFKSETSTLGKLFLKVAAAERDDFRFAHSVDSSRADEEIRVVQPTALHTKVEPSSDVFTGRTSDSLKKFIVSKIVGVTGLMNKDTAKFFDSVTPRCIVYFPFDLKMDVSKFKYIRNRVMKVAGGFKDKMTFVVANSADFPTDCGDFKGPAAVVIRDGKNRYPTQGEFTSEMLQKFVDQFTAGSLEPFIKSEPVPTTQGNVKVLVGKNFNEIVNTPGKDVFVEFYAPWCGHCKTLAPKWDQLADKLAGEDSVLIAKMDATANDYPPSFPVQGYPSLFWVSSTNKKSPVKYDGGREFDDLLKYVKEKATKKNLKIADGKKAKKDKKAKKTEL